MLDKPDIPEGPLAGNVSDAFGLRLERLEFLPLGADLNTAVYRGLGADGARYFVKLRFGGFDPMSVALPKYLSERGIGEIIAPLATQAGRLWADLGAFRAIVYPFVDGDNAYARPLSDAQWVAFGAAIRRIHAVTLPGGIVQRLQMEHDDPQWRARVRASLRRADTETFTDPVASQLATVLRERRETILDLVARTEVLASQLQTRERVLCHADLHAGNLLIGADGGLQIVDWDAPILAPKERDLMYAGGGQFGNARAPAEEEALFYAGYGEVEIDLDALAYYRYERIVQDIAVECDQVLLTDAGGDDRPQALRWLMSNFAPDGVLEIAHRQYESGKRHPRPGVRQTGDAASQHAIR
ncbi:MAG: aminoglycoside phosphotransferase family protein [Thermoflexales bacterium]|nr:aminoglycoside phosphotransferase family protein [Thermoflexales bacterium]